MGKINWKEKWWESEGKSGNLWKIWTLSEWKGLEVE